ncbi:hypothetical protein [Cupriavidus sp. AU9028]|uniref:hypothetical protein n=1 Tax=Cupriavidus sp. AU9028 TaxID=2871157 RepID=UPI001C97612D|nr:hypothetical protein [Cupriavidus sp. AU9028]MBY4895458.1 hypothetical protein [Cupriavidus sp. AU9028]
MPEIASHRVNRVEPHTPSPLPPDGTNATDPSAHKAAGNTALPGKVQDLAPQEDASLSSTSHVCDIWSRCSEPLTALKKEAELIPDARSRERLLREIDACRRKLEAAEALAQRLVNRLSMAKDSSAAMPDALMLMPREIRQLDMRAFTELEQQLSALGEAVRKARMPAGPLKISILTLAVTAATMVAAALASFALPPLGIALIFGAGVLIGTGGFGYLGVTSWRSDRLDEGHLRDLHAGIRNAIEGTRKTHQSLLPLLDAAVDPLFNTHANRVARETCQRLLDRGIGRWDPRLATDCDWGPNYPYLHDGKPVVSDATIAAVQHGCRDERARIDSVKSELREVARAEVALGKTGAADGDAAALVRKRYDLQKQLLEAKSTLEGALRGKMEAMEGEIDDFIRTQSKGDSDIAAALDFLLTQAPQRYLRAAMVDFLAARVGLRPGEQNPLFLHVDEDVAQTEVRVAPDGTVLARVGVVVPVRVDGDVSLGASGKTVSVKSGEVIRGEANLSILGNHGVVSSLTVKASDGMLRAAREAYAPEIDRNLIATRYSDPRTDPNIGLFSLRGARPPATAASARDLGEAVQEENRTLGENLAELERLFSIAQAPDSAKGGPAEGGAIEAERRVSANEQRAADLLAWADSEIQAFSQAFLESSGTPASVDTMATGRQWLARLRAVRSALNVNYTDRFDEPLYQSALDLLSKPQSGIEPKGAVPMAGVPPIDAELQHQLDHARSKVDIMMATLTFTLDAATGVPEPRTPSPFQPSAQADGTALAPIGNLA